ncbi:MAG: histidinol-phosphate transaminase [Pseudomonadales bacterium]|nr:histidinol-phosphate transaminase [Pseudomonadales bacterium]MCP5214797.1 histidinol-phosphate transaminase [Pseudomonadales bacterium]
MSYPQPKPGVLKIGRYVQGQSEIAGIENPIKLSSNESSAGPSPAAVEAYQRAGQQLNRYPDGAQTRLRRAIADVYNLDVERIICGNGSDELLALFIRAYAGEGDQVLLSENGFVMCRIHATGQGSEVVIAPERNYLIDVDALLDRVTDKTRVVIIASPNNPTGTYLPSDELKRLHEGLPKDVLFIIDGAYAEYVMRDDYEDGLALVDKFENIVVTRTFSKIYGLPSLRIGWAYCPEKVVDAVQRIRTPFNTNGPALAAAAAAVKDTVYTKQLCEQNAHWLERIASCLSELGLFVVPSVTNFYLIRFPGSQNKTAQGAAAYLQSQGIIPRPVGGEGDNHLRITVGLDHENEAVLQALTEYMQS